MRPMPQIWKFRVTSVKADGVSAWSPLTFGDEIASSSRGSTKRKPWNSFGLENLVESRFMARSGVQIHSPGSTRDPSESSNGLKASRRELTVSKMVVSKCCWKIRTSRSRKGNILDSVGVVRMDSLMKLSMSGSPFPVFSKIAYCPLSSSFRRGSRYSGCKQRSCIAKQIVLPISAMQRFHTMRLLPLTVETMWTDPNHSAMSSWTIRPADHEFCLGEVSITHWMQSFCSVVNRYGVSVMRLY